MAVEDAVVDGLYICITVLLCYYVYSGNRCSSNCISNDDKTT